MGLIWAKRAHSASRWTVVAGRIVFFISVFFFSFLLGTTFSLCHVLLPFAFIHIDIWFWLRHLFFFLVNTVAYSNLKCLSVHFNTPLPPLCLAPCVYLSLAHSHPCHCRDSPGACLYSLTQTPNGFKMNLDLMARVISIPGTLPSVYVINTASDKTKALCSQKRTD